MKKLILTVFAIAALVACKNDKKEKTEVSEVVKVEEVVEVEQQKGNVNVEKSVINWLGSKPTGTHNGTIKLKEGKMTVEEGLLIGGEFVVDMNSMVNLDIQKEKGKAKLIGHLKHADFFDVENYPTSKFVITSIKNEGAKMLVTGDLTIKDVTKSVTIPASLSFIDKTNVFKSEPFQINRAEFNVKYGSKSWFDNLKDKFINDMVTMSFTVVQDW